MSEDLNHEAVRAVVGDRLVRAYPALLSTEADALAWARAGAEAGALVVADYQASPRGRGGIPWQVTPGAGLGFSLIVRPGLPAGVEGWLYVAATLGLAHVAGSSAVIEWPDAVVDTDRPVAAVGVQADLGPAGVNWAVISVLVHDAAPPRTRLLADAVVAIEEQLVQDPDQVLQAYRPRCATLGREVRARIMPLGPTSPTIEGLARDVWGDGSLAIEIPSGRRRAVRPQDLGVLEEAT